MRSFLFFLTLSCQVLSFQGFCQEGNDFWSDPQKVNQRLSEWLDEGTDFFSIGNGYFYLKDYPRAILFYQKALKESPREEGIWQQLHLAQIHGKIPLTPKKRVFFWEWLSKKEQIHFLTLMTVLTTSVLSLALWRRSWRYWGRFFLLSWLFCLLCFLYLEYFKPPQGVLLQASYLYLDTESQNKVDKEPFSAGLTVKILDGNEEYLKVVISKDHHVYHQGYLLAKKIGFL